MDELLAQFLFGVGGALVLIYLRIFETLPRMTGSSEIKLREFEIEKLRKKWHEIAEKSEESKDTFYDQLRSDYQTRESELRKEIRSLKLRQWGLAAALYVTLGGLFTLVVFPLIGQDKIFSEGVIQPMAAVKAMGIGFTWTTYISLIEHKKPEKESDAIRENALEEVAEKASEVSKRSEETIAALKTDFEKYKKDARELIEKYKSLLEIK